MHQLKAMENPSEVRERILADHVILRRMLERVEVRARRVLQRRGRRSSGLYDELQALEERLRRHFELEERILVPSLRAADAWGAERVAQFHEEHARQREIMDEFARWGESPSIELALMVWGFVRLMLEDMAEEEKISLNDRVLRNDPIQPDIETD